MFAEINGDSLVKNFMENDELDINEQFLIIFLQHLLEPLVWSVSLSKEVISFKLVLDVLSHSVFPLETNMPSDSLRKCWNAIS